MLYAASSPEVQSKDITGKYLTPYGFVNNAPNAAPAGNIELAKALWKDSVETCRRHVPQLDIPEWIL